MNIPTSPAHFLGGIELPDLLRFNVGERLMSAAAWPLRSQQVRDHILPLAYGDMPPAPAQCIGVELHSAVVRRLTDARLMTLRIEADGRHAFLLRVFVPPGLGPFPVVVNGDACWHYATDPVIAEILKRSYVFAQFNRVEIAADVVPCPGSSGGPGQARHCAIASWAWGYHRALDVLSRLDFVRADALAVVGHSRGGKATLLAGATDTRVALTSANNSGAGGAGCFRGAPMGAETLGDLLDNFPHWFNPKLAEFVGRENDLPFDQHFLKALIAPRALLTTEAIGDLWANPSGTRLTHLAAQQVYGLLGVPEKIAIHYREGGHDHGFADWCTFLDFADQLFHLK